jgi:hypothetical protein
MCRLHTIFAVGVISACILILGSAAVGQKEDNSKEDPKKTENEAKKFEYPGAEVGANGLTERDGRSLYYFTMTTPDDLEKVLKHYEESTGQKLTVSAGTVSSRGRDDWIGAVQDDSIARVGNGNERTSPRPMTVRVVSVDAKAYHLTLVFSRAKEEKHTHIVATYVKK